MAKSKFNTPDTVKPHEFAKEAGLTPARIYQLIDAGDLLAYRHEVTRVEYEIPRVLADEFLAKRQAAAA